MIQHIAHIVDWTSVKLSALSIVLLRIGEDWAAAMAIAATATTVMYNVIRIFKELKRKKHE